MGALLRPLANCLAAVLALVLLGVLLLVSSGGDDRQQRALDHGLRELRELGTALQSEVVTADGLALAVSDRFRALELAFDSAAEHLEGRAAQAAAADTSHLQRARRLAFRGINVLDRASHARTDAQLRSRQLAELAERSRLLRRNVAEFSAHQQRYLAQRDAVQERGRQLVRQLRQRGFEAAADAAFAGLQQALDRIRRTVGSDSGAVANTLARLGEITVPANGLDGDLQALTGDVEDLLASRQAASEALHRVTASTFPELAETLRESVAGDHLYVLRTVSDARVLLNVYTLMMLLILVYFGFRLQQNHRVLNRSHTLLEERVKERTRELESAYDDLKESQVQLVQAEKMSSLGQLVAGVVHEINTPLLYVINNTDMTHESIVEVQTDLAPVLGLVRRLKAGELPPAQAAVALEDLHAELDVDALEESLSEIASLTTDSREGLNDIDELVKSLKDFSRLDRATYDRFDVRDGLEKTLLITKNMLKYGIEVERDFREVPDILCAPSRVNQVFINLITNAVQAMDGDGTLQIATYADNDGWVHVEIRDTGCGIPQDNLSRVMDPFFTTKPVGQGTGLGLSIVRRIMDEHQGRMLIDSKEGVGTMITLSFPIEGVARDGADKDEAEAA